jgi:chromosome partitioning protein
VSWLRARIVAEYAVNPFRLLVCLGEGHVWGESHQRPGFLTCRRCALRRRDRWWRESAARDPDEQPSRGEPGAMRTIAVVARKGGAGKTTIAVHLALAAYLRGHNVLVADTDPQGSASEALRMRTQAGPQHVRAPPSKLLALHASTQRAGADYLIVDTPGGADHDLDPALMTADLVLLVSRPTFLDLAAAVRMIQETRRLRRPVVIVLSQAPPSRAGQEPSSVDKALKALRFTNLPASPVILRTRAIFQTALASGTSVEEHGRSAASEEAAALWSHVEALLADEGLRACA